MNFDNNAQLSSEEIDTESELSMHENNLSEETRRKLRAFEQGDIASLDSPDIIRTIAEHIFNLYNKGDMSYALILLEILGDWSRSTKVEYRERSLMALSLITEKVIDEDNEDFLEALSRLLIRWLENETEYLTGFEFICLQLRKMVRKMLHLGLWYQTEDLIMVLFKIKSGTIKKTKIFTQVIARIHSSLAEKDLLEELTQTYVDDTSERREIAATLLINFGEKAALHLLYTLCISPEKSPRFHLIELIPATGTSIIPALVNLLRKKPPWYVVRNIILILSKLGDASLYYLVEPYLTYRDIRVQQEAVDCARRMNGDELVDRLLNALNVCNDKLKPQLVRLLGPIGEKRIGDAFINIIFNNTSLDQHVRDDVLYEILTHLATYPTYESIDALQFVITEKNKIDGISDSTITIAEKAFIALQQAMDFLEQPEQLSDYEAQTEQVAEKSRAILEQPEPEVEKSSDEPPLNTPHEESVASKIQITDNNEKWNTFSLSESASTDWLPQLIDDNLISPAIRQHLIIRKSLYNQFSEEEFNVFSSFLLHKSYKQGETIVAMGDVHSHLYFIDSGEVRLLLPEDKSECYTRALLKGDIFGNDIFMSGSEWDIALKAHTDVEIFSFDQEQLLKMQGHFPALAKKILAYCKINDVVLSIFRMADREKQFELESQESMAFTGNSGEPIADIQLIDISASGFCFSLNLPRGFGHTLFADKKLYSFFNSDSEKREPLESRVIGLKFIESDNCKLYIFAKFLQQEQLQGLQCERISLQ